MRSNLLLATLAIVGAVVSPPSVIAQAARPAPANLTVAVLERMAIVWSLRDEFLGKVVYNDKSEKIGSVDDLLVGKDKNDSYLIIGTGGFLGIGRSEIAVLISSTHEQDGKIVLPGGSKDAIRAIPSFDRATEIARRDRFIADAEQAVDVAGQEIQDLGRKSESAVGASKRTIDAQIARLKSDQKDVQDKLAIMKVGGITNWRAFEGDVNRATARLRKSIEKTSG